MFLPESIKQTQFYQKIRTTIKDDWATWLSDYRYIKSLKRKPPELMWKISQRAPNARYDAGGAQIKDKLYVIGGYLGLDHVFDDVVVYDLKKKRWVDSFPLAEGMPQTHHGLVGDGQRYIYVVTGQIGLQCSPATSKCFVLDTHTKQWHTLPDYPKVRYAPTCQLWQGRLHTFRGSCEDRHTPSKEHYSIAVNEGHELEENWKKEPPVPRGGPHGASAVLNGNLYSFGGQEGDWISIPGDPNYMGTGDVIDEVIYADSYMLEPGAPAWKTVAPMMHPLSHSDFSFFKVDDSFVICGGIITRDLHTRKYELTDHIQIYDALKDEWRLGGHLPYRIKHLIAAYYDGWLFIATGQRDRGLDDCAAGKISDRLWRAKFSLE